MRIGHRAAAGRLVRLAADGILLVGSAMVLAWAWRPAPRQVAVLALNPTGTVNGEGDFVPPNGIGGTTSAEDLDAAIPTVTLDYPANIRIHDAALVRLQLSGVSKDLLFSITEAEGSAMSTPDPVLAGAASRTLIVEVMLEMPSAQVRPNDAISAPAVPGKLEEFVWMVMPSEPGLHRGTAWTHLVLLDGENQEIKRITLSAQPMQIEGTTLLRLGGRSARIAGAAGLVLSAFLAVGLLDELLPSLLMRRRAKVN